MNNNSVPIIKPHKMKEYEFKQSKYDVAPRIPFSQIVVGPSGSGKSILLQNMIFFKAVGHRWCPVGGAKRFGHDLEVRTILSYFV